MKRALITLTICYLSLAAIAASAHVKLESCDVELQGEININADAIEITSDNNEQMVITDDYDLLINGDAVALDSEERDIVRSYANEIRTTIPEIVALALEGVEVGLAAVSEVFYAFSENGPPQPLLDEINQIQEKVAAKMRQNQDAVYLNGGELRGLESALADLEPALEKAVADAVGDMIVSVGESIRSGEESLTDIMSSLATKKERLERDLEARVSAKAEALEVRADGLCERVIALDAAERLLQARVPEVKDFSLVAET